MLEKKNVPFKTILNHYKAHLQVVYKEAMLN